MTATAPYVLFGGGVVGAGLATSSSPLLAAGGLTLILILILGGVVLKSHEHRIRALEIARCPSEPVSGAVHSPSGLRDRPSVSGGPCNH